MLLAEEYIHAQWQFLRQGKINGFILLTSNTSMPLGGWKRTTAKKMSTCESLPKKAIVFHILRCCKLREKMTRKLCLVQCSAMEDIAVLYNWHLLRPFHTYWVCSSHFNPGVVCLVYESPVIILRPCWEAGLSAQFKKASRFVWTERVIRCSCKKKTTTLIIKG